MSSPLNTIHYAFNANKENEVKLVAGYYSEMIMSYGIPVTYFRYNLDYYPNDGTSGTIANYTYGESPVSTYPVSADMVLYMDVASEDFLAVKLGMQTNIQSSVYFPIEYFYETWRDIIGTPTTGILTSHIAGTITNFSGNLRGDVINSDISGYTSANTVTPSGTISGSYGFNFIRYPHPINELLADPSYYTDMVVTGALSGTLTGSIDVSGNGSVGGDVSGVLFYFTSPSTLHGPHFTIAPQVGDFFRMKEFDASTSNYEEYEITQILDRKISKDGLSQLLGKYIWGCSIVRRDPSKEVVTGTTQEETQTPALIAENTWHQVISDKIFNYTNAVDTVDKENSDDAYGGH